MLQPVILTNFRFGHEALFIQTATYTFVRLLRFLSGRFDYSDKCRTATRGS